MERSFRKKTEERVNRGCYENPHSGVGMEFDTLEAFQIGRRLVLHECGYLKELKSWMFPKTLSPFWRLYYNAVPGHGLIYRGKKILLEPGHVVLIPGGTLFDSVGTEPVEHFWLTFSLAYRVLRPGMMLLPAGEKLTGEIREICDCFTGTGSGDRFRIYHDALALLHRIVPLLGGQLAREPRSEPLSSAVEILHRDFAKNLSMEEVAQRAGMSRRTLGELFQKEYQCSPVRYLSRIRVKEAAVLLTRTGMGLDMIAENTGFSDRFYLSKVFKQETGTSPGEYRRAHPRA